MHRRDFRRQLQLGTTACHAAATPQACLGSTLTPRRAHRQHTSGAAGSSRAQPPTQSLSRVHAQPSVHRLSSKTTHPFTGFLHTSCLAHTVVVASRPTKPYFKPEPPPSTHLAHLSLAAHASAALKRHGSRHRRCDWLRIEHSSRRDGRLGAFAGCAAQAVQVGLRAAQWRRQARALQAALRSKDGRWKRFGENKGAVDPVLKGASVCKRSRQLVPARLPKLCGGSPSFVAVPCHMPVANPACLAPAANTACLAPAAATNLKPHTTPAGRPAHLVQALPQRFHVHRLLLGAALQLQAHLQECGIQKVD